MANAEMAEAIVVRPVRPEEYEEAGRITALAYEEFVLPGDDEADWSDYLKQLADVAGRIDRTAVLVAVAEPPGRIVGCVTIEEEDVIGDDDVEIEPDASQIRMLGVDPSARGLGAGRALMEASIARARDLGKRFVTLRTTERMLPAQAMYTAMGFETDPSHDIVFDNDFRLIAYRLAL
jgi:ribosomal protein S18 acetylase RimI-like enzyme